MGKNLKGKELGVGISQRKKWSVSSLIYRWAWHHERNQGAVL